MAGKRSPTNKGSQSPKIEDLKLINGIGPAVEKRLNGVGIYTFAQLAVLSPADIAAALAHLTGLSSERIIKQDWIGQACKLAADEHASLSSIEPEKDVVPSTEHYRPATFTVEFLLDEHNSIHKMHVVYVQSKQEHTWMGWQKKHLVDFLTESAGLAIPSDEPDLLNAEVFVASEEPIADEETLTTEEPVVTEEPVYTPTAVPESEPLTPLVAGPTRLAGNLRISRMEVIGVAASDTRGPLTHDNSFSVYLNLDLTELRVPDGTLLNYKVSVHGKERVSHSNLVVGEAQGTIVPADTVTLNVECPPLPEGFYQLAATVRVALPGTKLSIKSGTTAIIGSTIQVY